MLSVAVCRLLRVFALSLLASVVVVSGAYAQGAAPKPAPAAPPPPKWHGALGGGVNWHGAATDLAGLLETITVPFNAMSSFTEMYLYQADLRNTDDNRMQFELRLNTQIAGPFGIQLAYLFDRENIVLGSVQQADQDFRVNFTY